ncbi:MAG: hypothetical protein WBP64_12195 [Nitrososphaeraceae archaeon]
MGIELEKGKYVYTSDKKREAFSVVNQPNKGVILLTRINPTSCNLTYYLSQDGLGPILDHLP